MASVDVLGWDKKKVGSVELAADVFEVEVNNAVLHEVVQWQLASRRQGTHMVKTRGLVSGGGKKPFKQKGTGNARQGTSRSPLMPGGGKLFGPVPRDYSYALPKKVRKLGLKMALSYLKKSGKLIVVDSMKSEGKTKELAQRMKTLGVTKAAMVDAQVDEKFQRAARNMRQYKYLAIEGLNVFDLLKYDTLIMTQGSVSKIAQRVQVG